MTLQEEFEEAVNRTKELTQRPSNDVLLKLYALYKQSTIGDVQGDLPNAMDFKATAKYRAWESLKGKPANTCQKEYIDLVNSLE
jgi:acyl-CoA-binding protein